MSEMNDGAEHLFRRTVGAMRISRHVEQHLLAEQAEAISGPMESASAPRPVSEHITATDTDNPDSNSVVDLGHSDPVPSQAARMGYFTNKGREILQAQAGVNKALDHYEQVLRSAISTKPDTIPLDEPTCPGWTIELQARLGGCGKHLEGYTRNDQTKGVRSLCSLCRKSKGQAERAAA